MHDVLLTIAPICVWVITAIHVLLLFVFISRYGKTRNMLFLLSGLVTLGLFYDALILSLGTVMTESAVLAGLSQVRYISHGALIPLLLPICAYGLDFGKTAKKVVWGITAILMVAGIASGLMTVTVPESVALVRYACDKNLTPGWANTVSSVVLAFGMVIPLILAGIVAWIKKKTPFLFLSGFLMFLFSALGPATGNMDLIFFISMFGEVLMVLFFYLYAEKTQKQVAPKEHA